MLLVLPALSNTVGTNNVRVHYFRINFNISYDMNHRRALCLVASKSIDFYYFYMIYN